MILRKSAVCLLSTAAFVMTVVAASLSPAPAASKMGTTKSQLKVIATGKKIATAKCIMCHGANLEGKGKMAPPLKGKGPMRHYTTAKLFERLMAKGLDEKAKPVRPPMNRIHLAKADADAVYAYLKTVK